MPKPSSRFRLQSSAFARNDETEKINPKRMIFLSVEGDETERTYFQNLNEYLDTNLIQIEVLRHRRGDGYSDPVHVIELLENILMCVKVASFQMNCLHNLLKNTLKSLYKSISLMTAN